MIPSLYYLEKRRALGIYLARSHPIHTLRRPFVEQRITWVFTIKTWSPVNSFIHAVPVYWPRLVTVDYRSNPILRSASEKRDANTVCRTDCSPSSPETWNQLGESIPASFQKTLFILPLLFTDTVLDDTVFDRRKRTSCFVSNVGTPNDLSVVSIIPVHNRSIGLLQFSTLLFFLTVFSPCSYPFRRAIRFVYSILGVVSLTWRSISQSTWRNRRLIHSFVPSDFNTTVKFSFSL